MVIKDIAQTFKNEDKRVDGKTGYVFVDGDWGSSIYNSQGKECGALANGTSIKMFKIFKDTQGNEWVDFYHSTKGGARILRKRVAMPSLYGDAYVQVVEKIVEKEVIKEVIKEVVVEKPVEVVKEVLVPQPIMVVTGQDQKQLEKVKESLVIDYNCEIVVPKK